MSDNIRLPDRFVLFGLLLFSAIGLPAYVEAADLGPNPSTSIVTPAPSQWEFRFTPYAWATSVVGESTVRGQTLDVDASFLDVVEESESIAALMGYFEARRGRLALYSDLVWSRLTFGGERSLSGPLGGLNISADAELDYEQLIIEAGVSYEIARYSRHSASVKDDIAGPEEFTAIDLLAAARYWRESVDLSLGITGVIGALPPGFEVSGSRVASRSGTMEWVDPVIGMRVRHQFSPGQELQLRGDIGGFDVGSDFSWQLFGGYSFALGDSWSGIIGYRALAVDFSEEAANGTRGIDLLQHGPVVGVNLRW
jgi:opacity protein-like surface antigen